MSELPEDGYVDPMRATHVAELETVYWLVQAGGLNQSGMSAAFHRFTTEQEITAATGNVAIIRERVVDALIVALANVTGAPESYWRDRTTIDVPDDVSGLT